ncbi:MAG: coproporphyrinogen III oxidase family protein [Chloroflexi bacterium]|nr:MAG: coproporphyrinogen III oxidase family protein [Chloroflexota bacterium]MBL1193508.1 radical SAM family heme chaperone HemW [Chloroflexota bacterium]NOH10799.1 radical SAM family heme chaperone HemW [Chloroflexota bacterium]
MSSFLGPYSLYLHIPFCRHKCGYCDFNTYAGKEDLQPDYVRALCAEITQFAEAAGERLPLHTVFFGGGTPSLLTSQQLEAILSAVSEAFELLPDNEITLEANPGTVDLASLQAMHAMGINRLSMGMQSANPAELRILERQHDFDDVVQAIDWARAVGFENINLDLIFGLPYQSIGDWQRNVELALGLNPEHLSLYNLTIEHGTPMEKQVGRGLLPEPDPDEAAEMYIWTMQHLNAEGWRHYEVSNWARPDDNGEPLACRHNLQYWRNLPYIGLGAGAHGFIGGLRVADVLGPGVYIERCLNGALRKFPRTAATASVNEIGPYTEMQETMMMGLRLLEEGVSSSDFEERFGKQLEDVFAEEIAYLRGLGLLEKHDDRWLLTGKGRMLGNQVFMQFV